MNVRRKIVVNIQWLSLESRTGWGWVKSGHYHFLLYKPLHCLNFFCNKYTFLLYKDSCVVHNQITAPIFVSIIK